MLTDHFLQWCGMVGAKEFNESSFGTDVGGTQGRLILARKTFFPLLHFKVQTFWGDCTIWKSKPMYLPIPCKMLLALFQSLYLTNRAIVLTLLCLFQLVGILMWKKPWTGKTLALVMPSIRAPGIRAVQTVCFLDCTLFLTEWMPYSNKVQRVQMMFSRPNRKAEV